MFEMLSNLGHYVFWAIIITVLLTKTDIIGGFVYLMKYIFARCVIAAEQKDRRDLKKKFHLFPNYEDMHITEYNRTESIEFIASDQNGNQIEVRLKMKYDYIMEYLICFRLDGKMYVLPKKINSSESEHPVWTERRDKYQWKCHCMEIEILEPLKRCRVSFNGFLMDVSSKSYNNIKHMKFNLIWNCCSKPNFSWVDSDLNLLARFLAESKWVGNQHFMKYVYEEKYYTQFGALKGIIQGENMPEMEVNMACVKNKNFGLMESHHQSESLTVFVYTENGYILYFGVKSVRSGWYKFGYVLTHSGTVHPLQNTDLQIDVLKKNMFDPIIIHVNANNQLLKISLSVKINEAVKFINNETLGYKCQNIPAEGNVNGNKANAVLYNCCFHPGMNSELPSPILSHLKMDDIPYSFVTKIGSEESKILELAGGKGSSLGLMKCLNNEEICIPDGFIITTYAFQQQIDSNIRLQQAIWTLDSIALGKLSGNLENTCKVTQQLFADQVIIPNVEQSIQGALMNLRKSHDKKIPYFKVAVRSSAICEDTDGFSSAGQNETFLGCQPFEELLKKVCKCWGSLFSYQSVTYRRQHGLPIETSMAVVVQMMIPADAAGVLFTCHPSTMNPGQMVITSNFGLGETVVSGQVEPDTIIISKSFDGEVQFESYSIGAKNYSFVLNEDGIHKKELTNKQFQCKSLSEMDAVELAKLGVTLERAFGGPRDIEWAIFKGRFYILQSRAITTLNQWTDYELLHEFDTPHLSNDIFYTRANIGEVLPFALTPLTQSTIVEGTEKGYQMSVFGNYNPYVSLSIVYSHHYGMIDLLGGLYAKPRKDVEISFTMIDLAVFGHPVLDDELNAKAIARYGILSNTGKIKEYIKIVKTLWEAPNMLKEMLKNISGIQIDIRENDSVSDIYNKIDKLVKNFVQFAHTHCLISVVSIVYQTIAMVTLMEGNKEITAAHYSDLALILSSCDDVISAEVPTRLAEIVEVLRKNNLSEKFTSVDAAEGVTWLKYNCKRAYELFEDFINAHGHRLLGEFELSLNSWEMEPATVIKMLQVNCKASKSVKNAKGIETNIIDSLMCPKKLVTKIILRYLINKYRSAVGNREISKSALVKLMNKLKIAYRTLATEMTQQGFIPSESLIFHLTHNEIWQIIHRKNPTLVMKAVRRQKLYPSWNKLKFPEIIYGIPIPDVEDSPKLDISNSDICINGTAVCVGESLARACVINSLDEINDLEDGDILITRSTDVGWSPYFPILSGIVTELGGLMSHGAVVAREYGLPCIVGAKNATKVFKTGQRVFLSGKLGRIRLIPE